jgi:hypothetical protein
MRYLRKILLGLLLLLPVAVVFVVLDDPRPIDDAYAQWSAVDMVIAYMDTNGGKWPPNWEALRSNFKATTGRVGSWSFDEFKQRVLIDFAANADDLRRQAIESETVPFNVIHARSMFAAEMADGPNATLHRYFRKKSGIVEAPTPHGGWQSQSQRKLADDWYRHGFHIRFDKQGEIVAAWTALAERPPPGDREIAEWTSHVRLKELNLVGSHVTDAGLAVIKALPNLEVLDLGGDNITDGGLEHLSGHPRLESLDFFGTQITDAGLQRLHELPRLQSIRFDERRISMKAVEKLKSAVPNLTIRAQGELRGAD